MRDLEIQCSCGNGLCSDCAMEMRQKLLRLHKLHRPVQGREIVVCESCTSLRDVFRPPGYTGGVGVAWPCASARAMGVTE